MSRLIRNIILIIFWGYLPASALQISQALQYGENPAITIATYVYDKAGRVEETLRGDGMLTDTYAYTASGLPTVISSVAAINGMSWKSSRMAFDAYESKINEEFTIEDKSTRNAEYYSWKMGYRNTDTIQNVNNISSSFRSLFKYLWNTLFK